MRHFSVSTATKLKKTPIINFYNLRRPLFSWTMRLDPLSAYFSLTLGILAAAVSMYSFGYLRHMEGRRSLGALGFFYNVLLLSLTLVFTAANAFFFLVAWEVMALSAYCLVSFEHEKKEARNAGMLFLIMSHAGTGLLLIAFLVLATAERQPGFCQLPSAGIEASSRGAGRGLPAVLRRLRREGGHHPAARLAAGGAPGGAQQHLGADVGHRDQDRHLRHGARVFRFLRCAAAVGGNRWCWRRAWSRRCWACSTR